MVTENLSAEKYYLAVKPQTNNIHSIHREGCPFLPGENKRILLGLFHSGIEAGNAGKKYISNSHGCRFCARETFDNERHSHAHREEVSAGLIMKFLN